MRVFALGSCRIYNPLAASHEGGEVDYLNLRVRSKPIYLHNPEEMIQFCKAATGHITIPANVAPFAFYWGLPRFNDEWADVVRDAEQIVIEICSDKAYRALGYALNLNALHHQLVESSGDAGRTWWRNLHRGLASDQDVIATVEHALDAAGKLTGMHSAMLREIRFVQLSADDLAASVAELRALIDRPILIVPHVAVRLADGQFLADRMAHISKVMEAAERLGLPILDPRGFVERDGQERALGKDGTDFNHYTEEYVPTVGHEIVQALRPDTSRNETRRNKRLWDKLLSYSTSPEPNDRPRL